MTAILKVDEIQDTAGNNIINENANTVTIGKAGDTVALAGSSVTGITQGITMLQQWYLSSTYAISGSSETRIASTNWAKASSISGRGIPDIGSSMTASSGIFTFPSTGIYTVEFQTTINPGNDTNYQTGIRFTTDNSTYNRVAWAYIGFETDGNPPSRGNTFVKAIVDVTDTSNCKIDTFGQDNDSVGINVMGDGSPHTSLTFTRIGDT